MTIEDFRKLKTGDKVIVWKVIYNVSVGWNHYRIPFVEFLNEGRSVYRIYDKESCGIISVYENDNNFLERFVYNEFRFLCDMEMYDEKKWLEIQLKEEQERIQQEIDTSNKKQEQIQKKLVEITLPQIGKMYNLTCISNNHSWYGVATNYLRDKIEIVSFDHHRKIVTEYFHTAAFNKGCSFVEVPEKEHIAKSILEFIKLGEQQ